MADRRREMGKRIECRGRPPRHLTAPAVDGVTITLISGARDTVVVPRLCDAGHLSFTRRRTCSSRATRIAYVIQERPRRPVTVTATVAFAARAAPGNPARTTSGCVRASTPGTPSIRGAFVLAVGAGGPRPNACAVTNGRLTTIGTMTNSRTHGWRARLRDRYTTTRLLISLIPDAAAIHARSALATCLRRGYVGLQGLVYGATDVTSDPGFIKPTHAPSGASIAATAPVGEERVQYPLTEGLEQELCHPKQALDHKLKHGVTTADDLTRPRVPGQRRCDESLTQEPDIDPGGTPRAVTVSHRACGQGGLGSRRPRGAYPSRWIPNVHVCGKQGCTDGRVPESWELSQASLSMRKADS